MIGNDPGGGGGGGGQTNAQRPRSKNPCAGKDLSKLQNQFAQRVANQVPGASVIYDRSSNVANGITFAGSYEQTTSQLRQAGYYTGIFAYNPFNHAGGLEFRTYGSPGFHFKVNYPREAFVASGVGFHQFRRDVRLPGQTKATDLHIDCFNPVGSSWNDKLSHFVDFLSNNGIEFYPFTPVY